LYAEMGDLKNAESAFRQTITLNPGHVRALYNFGLLLSQNGRNPEAEKLYMQALKTDPRNGDVLYALTILYVQENNQQKAMETGRLLKQYHGNNPAYRDLLMRMRLN
jgi:tetratricopeptide (TPR) repeat protein